MGVTSTLDLHTRDSKVSAYDIEERIVFEGLSACELMRLLMVYGGERWISSGQLFWHYGVV